jgi:protein-S-isoprenylcysteine O-methyltransferase
VSAIVPCIADPILTLVCSWFRHPSYAGFYYWALGTQFVLQNVVTTVLFSYLLWKFFYRRTRSGCGSVVVFDVLADIKTPVEEDYLVSFFGKEYQDYRRRVGTKIPFVP